MPEILDWYFSLASESGLMNAGWTEAVTETLALGLCPTKLLLDNGGSWAALEGPASFGPPLRAGLSAKCGNLGLHSIYSGPGYFFF